MTETGQEIRQWAPPQALERLSVDQIKFIANTEVIPKALRGNPAAIIAVVLKGRALGLDDIHALSAIHFIEGKPTLAAETMMMLARRAGHSITVKADVDSATAKGKRADNGDTYEVTWTMEDASRAGLTGKQNWQRHPRQMLSWRATSELCRVLFPDVLAGTGYTPDELERSPEEVAADALRVSPSAADGGPDDTVETADWAPVDDLAEEPSDALTAVAGSAEDDRPRADADEPSSAEEPEAFDGFVPSLADAAAALIPEGRYKGQQLAAISDTWIRYALKAPAGKWPPHFAMALEVVAREQHPDVWREIRGDA